MGWRFSLMGQPIFFSTMDQSVVWAWFLSHVIIVEHTHSLSKMCLITGVFTFSVTAQLHTCTKQRWSEVFYCVCVKCEPFAHLAVDIELFGGIIEVAPGIAGLPWGLDGQVLSHILVGLKHYTPVLLNFDLEFTVWSSPALHTCWKWAKKKLIYQLL